MSAEAKEAAEILKGRKLSELSQSELEIIAKLALREVPHKSADDLNKEATALERSIGKMEAKAAAARSGELTKQVNERRRQIAAGHLAEAGVRHAGAQTPKRWAEEDG